MRRTKVDTILSEICWDQTKRKIIDVPQKGLCDLSRRHIR